MRRRPFLIASILVLAVVVPCLADVVDDTTMSADDAITRLKAGNARFVEGKREGVDFPRERKELAGGQKPYAIVLSCADSRVPPELVFDESLGKLFVIREAGNVTDPVTLGSMEYAAEHLHARLILVMGHDSCGAVTAALDGAREPPHVQSILNRIRPAVVRAKARKLDHEATLAAAIEENVLLEMRNTLRQSPVLRALARKKQLKIVGAVYRLSSGRVDFLEDH